MSVKELIKSTLLPIGVPISVSTGSNNENQYIIFNEYNQDSMLNADDEEISTKYFYQVDVFSTGSLTALVNEVKDRLKEAGFKRMFESETFDEDAQKFRKILRFSYATDIE